MKPLVCPITSRPILGHFQCNPNPGSFYDRSISRLSAFVLFVCSTPGFASVTVVNPHNGDKLVSPFWLSATASPCSSQPVTAMGYSFDNSSNTTIVTSTIVNASVSTTIGTHTLHVKSWGNLGASCVTDIDITVVAPPTASVPSYAIVVNNIQDLKTWHVVNDTGTGSGTSTGTMSIVSSPSLSGVAREFVTSYSNSGGERYDVSFGTDPSAKNFLYDTWVYLTRPSSDIANLEFDMNQVIWNGDTVIYGFQCDGYTNTWDYTANEGSPANFSDQWLHSRAYCNPREWTTNTWHHVQITYSRDSNGNVTYKSVWLDGVEEDIDATVPSAFALGWGSVLLTNFQVDGLGGYGSATVYLDELTVYRW